MKRHLAPTLITVVSLGLSTAIFAANLEEGQITGTIVEAVPLTIDTAKKGVGISRAILIRSRLN